MNETQGMEDVIIIQIDSNSLSDYLNTIMNVDSGCDYFDLPISEVLQDQHLGILGMLCLQG